MGIVLKSIVLLLLPSTARSFFGISSHFSPVLAYRRTDHPSSDIYKIYICPLMQKCDLSGSFFKVICRHLNFGMLASFLTFFCILIINPLLLVAGFGMLNQLIGTHELRIPWSSM